MPKILVIYYSRSGNTQKMADLVAEGVRKSGAEATVVPVDKAKVGDMEKVDGVIMGSPTYYGTMAAELKKFLDDSVRLHGRLVGKVAGAFSSAANVGGGNETTVLDILKAFLIHGMIVPGNVNGDHYGPVSINAPDKRASEQCLRMGEIVGALAVRLASK